MERGPFRVPQPSERRAASRSAESSERAASEPQSVAEAPRPAHRASSRRDPREEKSKKRLLLPIIGILVAIAAIVGGLTVLSMNKNALPAIDSSKYQAVFFTNGQVYFGKLQASGDYMKLTDVYYLQAQNTEEDKSEDSENPQKASSNQNNVQLIKLGDEIHGPADEMIIVKDQVLFYENLKSDGKVAQSIAKYKNP